MNTTKVLAKQTNKQKTSKQIKKKNILSLTINPLEVT